MAKEEIKQPKRWSAGKKREVVLRLLRGEPLDEVSRDVGVESYRIDQWRDQALVGMTEMLKERVGDPTAKELDRAKKQIGELSNPSSGLGPSEVQRNFTLDTANSEESCSRRPTGDEEDVVDEAKGAEIQGDESRARVHLGKESAG
jgi:hypothetical protein